VKKTRAALLAVSIAISSGMLVAQVTTVFLPKEEGSTFKVAGGPENLTATLQFAINPAFTAEVRDCSLRVVPTQKTKIGQQDVTVFWNNKDVGDWPASPLKTRAYFLVEDLPRESCAPQAGSVFTLKTESQATRWEYYGSGAAERENRPRLIVTYNLPAPARSGDVTDWKYSNPASFFSSSLWSGSGTTLTNPVSWEGAAYFAASSGGTKLFRVAGAGNVANWPLNFTIDGVSFAFVTPWGQLRIVTNNAIYSCNLKKLESLKSTDFLPCEPPAEGIALKAGEAPAMGPDGSLYFKNVKAGGSIVAYNPALQEIWRTGLLPTNVSPIAFNADGRYAYVLAKVAVEGPTHYALLRIDTATGETGAYDISYEENENEPVKPDFAQLLKPVVVSKVVTEAVNGRPLDVDYVFVAANTNETGVLQLVPFKVKVNGRRLDVPPREDTEKFLVWNLMGKIAAPPVAGLDGNSLFVAWQSGTIRRFPWFNTAKGKEGAYPAAPESEKDKLGIVTGVSKLLVDGGGSVYLVAEGSLSVIPAGSKPVASSSINVAGRTLGFTDDGTLIGYGANDLFDYSPKSGAPISPSALATGTIYSAGTVTLPANPGMKDGQVIIKGNNLQIPLNFQWPPGATLKLQSIP
jgi:hypothetical protein